jgi:hypothetical protein
MLGFVSVNRKQNFWNSLMNIAALENLVRRRLRASAGKENSKTEQQQRFP